jgi:hypothetical protein
MTPKILTHKSTMHYTAIDPQKVLRFDPKTIDLYHYYHQWPP